MKLRLSSALAGFSLVEMLVAVAVLGLLVVMVAQILSMSSNAINFSSHRIEATAQGRLALDRMELDFTAWPKRGDMAVQFLSQNGNDTFGFYSQMPGYGGTRSLSAVNYRVNGTTYQLERGIQGTEWSATTSSFLPMSFPTIPDQDYDVLSAGTFRLEFVYLLNSLGIDGRGTDAGQLHTTAASDFSNVSAVIVAIATIDADGQKLLSSSQLQTLGSNQAFPDATNGSDIATNWQAQLDTPGAITGVPKVALQRVRIYERYFYVH